jgi:hypothetical protein
MSTEENDVIKAGQSAGVLLFEGFSLRSGQNYAGLLPSQILNCSEERLRLEQHALASST